VHIKGSRRNLRAFLVKTVATAKVRTKKQQSTNQVHYDHSLCMASVPAPQKGAKNANFILARFLLYFGQHEAGELISGPAATDNVKHFPLIRGERI